MLILYPIEYVNRTRVPCLFNHKIINYKQQYFSAAGFDEKPKVSSSVEQEAIPSPAAHENLEHIYCVLDFYLQTRESKGIRTRECEE